MRIWNPPAILLAATLVLHAGPPAIAQDDPFAALTEDQALELLGLLEIGDAARERQDWERALEAYQGFLEVVPDGYVAIDAARALVALDRLAEADAAYRDLVASAEGELLDAAQQELAALYLAHPARLRCNVDAADAVILAFGTDGAVISMAPGQWTLFPPGTYTVTVQAPYAPVWSVMERLAPGQERDIDVATGAPNPAATQTPPAVSEQSTAMAFPGAAPAPRLFVDDDVERGAAEASLSFDVRPRAASVTLTSVTGVMFETDGRETLALEPGPWTIDVVVDGFAPSRVQIQVDAGRAYTYSLRFDASASDTWNPYESGRRNLEDR